VNSHEAKELLLLFRPAVDHDDPEFTEALTLAKSDPELAAWFQHHCAFQNAATSAFDDIPVPDGLKEQILSERKAHLALSSRRRALVAACSLAVIAIAGFFTFRTLVPPGPPRDYSFNNFHERMMSKIIRYPKMDLYTNDLQAIRQNLAQNGQTNLAFAPFTPSLEQTAGTGCASFDWQQKPVAMVCFNSGKKGATKSPDLFLFIADKSSVTNPPAGTPVIAHAHGMKNLISASWSSGNKVYVLGALGDEAFLKQYF
jgi:hypothetical protein